MISRSHDLAISRSHDCQISRDFGFGFDFGFDFDFDFDFDSINTNLESPTGVSQPGRSISSSSLSCRSHNLTISRLSNLAISRLFIYIVFFTIITNLESPTGVSQPGRSISSSSLSCRSHNLKTSRAHNLMISRSRDCQISRFRDCSFISSSLAFRSDDLAIVRSWLAPQVRSLRPVSDNIMGGRGRGRHARS